MIELNLNNKEVCQQKTPVCAVVGDPVAHSLSPQIHQNFAKQCGITLIYNKILGDDHYFELQVDNFFKDGGLGLNITSPFKFRAFDLAVHHEPVATKTKAANTLWLNSNGELCADNTDGAGLIIALKNHTQLDNKSVLLLGAGGAAQGVTDSLLAQRLSRLTIANRTIDKLTKIKTMFPDIYISSFENLKNEFDIIINATTSSLNNTLPNIPTEIIRGSVCLDMFYDLKGDTTFVEYSKKQGALKSIDGYEMLVGQAAKSFERWHNRPLA